MKNDKYSVGDRTGKHNTFSSRILSYGKVATLTPSHLFRFRVKLPNSMLEGLKQYYLLHMPDCQLNVMGSNPRQDRTTLINFCSMSAADCPWEIQMEWDAYMPKILIRRFIQISLTELLLTVI